MSNYVLSGNGADGFQGVASQSDVEALNKALTAGYGYEGAPSELTGGGAMMVESLEASLKSTTWSMKHLVLWPSMPIDKAYNTVEEYSRITSYGGSGGIFFNEGGSPREEDATYNRATQRIAYMGTRRQVAHPMMLVRVAFGDAVAREINNGNMWILQGLERKLYFANSEWSNAGVFDGAKTAIPGDGDSTLEFNGLDQQIREGDKDANVKAIAWAGYGAEQSVVFDAKGEALDEDILEDAAVTVLNNFGMPTELHLSTEALRDLSKQFYHKERLSMGSDVGKAGYVLREFISSAGTFKTKPSVFLRPKTVHEGTPMNSEAPKSANLAATGVAAAGATATTLSAGAYSYRVAGWNVQGESAPVDVTEAVAGDLTAADGDTVTLTISDSVDSGAIGYAVYRSVAGGSAESAQFIGYVRRAGAGNTTFIDMNKKLPGTSQAFLLFMDPEALKFKQLAPLTKINLATVAAAFQWLQVLYGTLIVFTPRKHALIENIGTTVAQGTSWAK